jgi:hypothetical protein
LADGGVFANLLCPLGFGADNVQPVLLRGFVHSGDTAVVPPPTGADEDESGEDERTLHFFRPSVMASMRAWR